MFGATKVQPGLVRVSEFFRDKLVMGPWAMKCSLYPSLLMKDRDCSSCLSSLVSVRISGIGAGRVGINVGPCNWVNIYGVSW